MPTVYFAHGKESGPWGPKILALAEVARAKGFEAISPDYSGIDDPDERVKQLLAVFGETHGTTVLVGSSMGGYVSTVASEIIKPAGLFLMAPAFYIPDSDYSVQAPVPFASRTVVVHGWNDDIVPVDNSIEFARKHRSELHLLNSDHRLNDQIPLLVRLFTDLLEGLEGGRYALKM
jgi:predicted alpha/beta hydrolase family esterase